jgi:hypothetical protein
MLGFSCCLGCNRFIAIEESGAWSLGDVGGVEAVKALSSDWRLCDPSVSLLGPLTLDVELKAVLATLFNVRPASGLAGDDFNLHQRVEVSANGDADTMYRH